MSLSADGPVVPEVVQTDAESVRDQRRRQILEAAERAFVREGFHGASMHTICAEARMSPGALYRYFRSKEEIIAAIAEDERRRAFTVLQRLEGPGSVVDRVVAAALAYFEEMERPGATALALEVMSEGMRNTAIGETFLCNEVAVRDQLHLTLAAAQDAGEVAAGVDLCPTISMLMAFAEGIVIRRAFDPMLTRARIEPMLRCVTETLLRPVEHADRRLG